MTSDFTAVSPAGLPDHPHGLPQTLPIPAGADGAGSGPVPAIVEQWATAWNAADAEGMAGLFTPDGIYDDHAFQARSQGREAIAVFVAITAQHIPGAHCEVVEAFQAGDGGRIAVQWIFSGTPKAFGDAPATGRSFSVPVVTILEMKAHKIQHDSDYYNLADLFRQVGLPSGPWVPLAP